MSVAHVSPVFVGGLWDRQELKRSEVRPDLFQGPIPAYLLEDLEDEPAPRPRKLPQMTPFRGMTDAPQRREKAQKGAANRWKASPPPVAAQSAPELKPVAKPWLCCPECGGPTIQTGGGNKAAAGYWRRCLAESCGTRYRTQPKPEKPPSDLAPCPHCEGRSIRNGKLKDGRIVLKCTACERSFRPALKLRQAAHCRQGHPFSEENTGRYGDGCRRCRICQRERVARRQAARKARRA